MNTKGDLIALTLNNIATTDSQVNLLASGIGGGSNGTTQNIYSIEFLDIFPNVEFDLVYNINGSTTNYFTNVEDITELMYYLNTILGSYAEFSYEISPNPTYSYYLLIIKTINPTFQPISLAEQTTNICANCTPHDVVIGTQTWTGCNANVDTYANGDPIPQVTDPIVWAGLTTGAWCYYDNDPLNGAKYGKLYNWYAVNDSRGLAPTGYHVPSVNEWYTLSAYLSGYSIDPGGELKEANSCSWYPPNIGATDSTGFTGLPGGLNQGGFYSSLNNVGYFWTFTLTLGQANHIYLWTNNAEINFDTSVYFYNGMSVRFIKD
jgi:uncharacterized protein (TIGR02145 family)